MQLSNTVKNILFIALGIVALSILPGIINSFKSGYEKYLDTKTKVGVIVINETLCDSYKHQKILHKYFKDDDIKAILIKMECPGGAAGTSQALFNEIITLKTKYPKPIITLVENICASGGYYIASATDYIIAPGSAIIGSIGTGFSYVFQLKEFIEQFKIRSIPLTAGQYKNTANPLVDMTEQEKQLLQTLLNDSYEQFVSDVAGQRKINPAQKNIWAEGKIFTARQALGLKLIDELGSSSTAITIIKERAKIDDEIKWVCEAKKEGLMSWLGYNDNDSCGLFNRFFTMFFNAIEQRYGKPVIN